MFLRAIRSAVCIFSIVAILAAALCFGGLGIGWLLNAIIPSIDFGLAVLIAVVAFGFSGAMFLAVSLLLPVGLRLLEDEQEQPEIGEDEEEFEDDELAISADEERTMLLARFVDLSKRRDAFDHAQPYKTKRRRAPKPRRGGK